jgi:adenine deaminase
MKILIREGSAAKNFDTLCSLLKTHPDMCMLCSDDKHPDELTRGHINHLVKRAIDKGFDIMNVLRTAIINPIEHYTLDVGLLRIGDDADFIVVDNLKDFNVNMTYIRGIKVAENGKSLIQSYKINIVNNFNTQKQTISNFIIKAQSDNIRVIEAIDGEIITGECILKAKKEENNIVSDIKNDVLKIAVINRYYNSKPAVAFVKNFGLKRGAIASSVAHDSHNIVAVGTTDDEICKAVNAIIEAKGGMAVVDGNEITLLELPVAGLMSNLNGFDVAQKYLEIDKKAKSLGCTLAAPFMTLSFMSLLVIPKLKLSDKGLFDGERFKLVDIYA